MSTSLASLSSNFFPSPQNGFTTTLASTISSGAATVPLNSVAGYSNGQIAVFVIEPASSTAKQTFTGVIDTSGVQVTSVVWTAGTNQSHAGGVTVVDYATATHIGMMTKGITQQHNLAGAHTAITATSVAATGTINASTVSSLQDTGVALSTYRNESQTAFTASGGVWTADAAGSTRNGSMTALVCYINGQRGSIGAVTAHSFTASKDTYVDVLNTAGVFTLVYTEVTNNAASPALAANSMRIAIVVTGASNIATAASINQGDPASILPIASSVAYSVTDSLGNLIGNRTPTPSVIGYRQITSNFTTTSGTAVQVTGLTSTVTVPAGGRRIKITAYSFDVLTTTGASPTMTIWDGTVGSGTQLQQATYNPSSTNLGVPMFFQAIVTSAAGSKTYNVGLHNLTGGQNATLSASATAPACVIVELV